MEYKGNGYITIWDVWEDIEKAFTKLSKSLDEFSRMLPKKKQRTKVTLHNTEV